MPKGPECQVERCKFPATKMHRLKEQSGPFDYPPTDFFAVCDIHKDKLSDSATEWMLLYEDDGVRRLLVGPMLTELDEFFGAGTDYQTDGVLAEQPRSQPPGEQRVLPANPRPSSRWRGGDFDARAPPLRCTCRDRRLSAWHCASERQS